MIRPTCRPAWTPRRRRLPGKSRRRRRSAVCFSADAASLFPRREIEHFFFVSLFLRKAMRADPDKTSNLLLRSDRKSKAR